MFSLKILFEKFRKIQKKTPVQESLFKIKLQACKFIKKETLALVFSW